MTRSLKPSNPILLSLLLSGILPSSMQAQDAPPPGLAEVELARSRECVATLADLAALNAILEPIALRLDRLNALGRAVSLEKAADAAPFDSSDSLEQAVAQWFSADSALAVRFLETQDSALIQERGAARAGVLERIDENIRENAAEGQERAQEGAPVRAAAQQCDGAIFVRSAVLEACSSVQSALCDAAASEEAVGSGRFVESPEDLWDVEQYRPWTQPTALGPSPEGGLTGARTSAQARRGNVVFSLALSPLILQRTQLSPEEIQEAEAHLDSLGFIFDHPLFVMAPGLELQARLPGPIGGETHYVLHFGDLSGDDVVWTIPAGTSGPLQVSFPAEQRHLARLRADEPVSFTALRMAEGEGAGSEAEAVFTLSLLQVGQGNNVGTLLDYMANGALNRDLAALVPPGGGGGGGR